MGDDWTISVWFRGGSWLDPARRQHAGHEGRCVICILFTPRVLWYRIMRFVGAFVLTCLSYLICITRSLAALRSGTLYVKAAWATKFLRSIMYDKERSVCLCV